MSLREAAEALIDDYDNVDVDAGQYRVHWPQMEALRDALAEAEKAEPAELSDDDIEAIWFATVEDMPRDSTNREIRVACVRAVLAAARGKG